MCDAALLCDASGSLLQLSVTNGDVTNLMSTHSSLQEWIKETVLIGLDVRRGSSRRCAFAP
jgi:hypothetical protein